MPPISQAAELARLSTLIEGMAKRMEEDRTQRSKDDEKAQATTLAIEAQLRMVITAVDDLKSDMAEVKPVTQMVTGWRFMAMGALGLLGIFGGAIVGFLKFIGVNLPGTG